MLLTELKITKPLAARPEQIIWYIDRHKKRAQEGVKVKTNNPNIVLSVYKSDNGKYFIVFPMIKTDDGLVPAGYVEFVTPDRLGQPQPWADNVRTPHSGFYEALRGLGVAKMIYRWFLDAGHILVTGHEQSAASNQLWRSLSQDYEVVFFDKKGRFIDSPTPTEAQQTTNRMALLGKGQTKQDIFKD